MGIGLNYTDITSFDWQPLLDTASDMAVDAAKAQGKSIAEKALDAIKTSWKKIDVAGTQEKYKKNLSEHVNTTKVLGNPRSINVEN